MMSRMSNLTLDGRWDAAAYFKRLTEVNRLARKHGFLFSLVSGLEGFEEAVGQLQGRAPMVCVSDQSDGYTELTDTPHIRQVKTIFLTAPHELEDMQGRARAMALLRELFRQFLSHLIQERTRLMQGGIYIDPRISFSEIDRYFFASGACAFFQVTIDRYADLSFSDDEWIESPDVVGSLNL